MRTPTPCVKDGKPCDKRQMGCHSGCEDFTRWEAIHAAEMAQERKRMEGMRQADDFRAKLDTRTRYKKGGKSR